jgi:hypothetical protein
MPRVLRNGFCLGMVLLVAAGCAVNPAGKPWWALTEANFRALQSGKTNKVEARAALGQPFAETAFPNQREEVWDYRFPEGSRVMLAWVYFDASGVYKYYTAQPDPAYTSGKD